MSHESEQMLSGEGAREVLVIRASEWLRGDSAGVGGLLSGGRLCCLGLDARRCGVPDPVLVNKGVPSQVARAMGDDCPAPYRDRWTRRDPRVGLVTSSPADQAMVINDDRRTSDDQKIAALRPIFESAGVSIDWRPNE